MQTLLASQSPSSPTAVSPTHHPHFGSSASTFFAKAASATDLSCQHSSRQKKHSQQHLHQSSSSQQQSPLPPPSYFDVTERSLSDHHTDTSQQTQFLAACNNLFAFGSNANIDSTKFTTQSQISNSAVSSSTPPFVPTNLPSSSLDKNDTRTASPEPMSYDQQNSCPTSLAILKNAMTSVLSGSMPQNANIVKLKQTSTSSTSNKGFRLGSTPSPLISFSHDDFANLVQEQISEPDKKIVLLLDMRTYAQHFTSRIHGALHLCVPSCLIKRGSFSVDRIRDTFSNPNDRLTLQNWKSYRYILFYDHNSNVIPENCHHISRKFHNEDKHIKLGWLKGGFATFELKHPKLCDSTPRHANSTSKTSDNQHGLREQSQTPVKSSSGFFSTLNSQIVRPGDLAAGSFSQNPDNNTNSPANPFFDNIRQNMDLRGGMGPLIPIRFTEEIKQKSNLPLFLRKLITDPEGARVIAERFHSLEESELLRMKGLMEAHSKDPHTTHPFSIGAALEQGQKNRYVNIWPFDHTLVKVGHNTPSPRYVNASYISTPFAPNKKYIATQGPLPTTYVDFWQTVWEHDSRVIVMLTKEKEGGMIKCHRYWDDGTYGDLKLELIETREDINQQNGTGFFDTKSDSILNMGGLELESVGMKRHASVTGVMSTPNTSSTPITISSPFTTSTPISPITNNHVSSSPSLVIRKFKLSYGKQVREITQLHYIGWPDFGVPSSPIHLLDLIDKANWIQRNSGTSGPLIVHCSAGVGRTGAFITVDTVLECLRSRHNLGEDDLVAATVSELRKQRMSMVQSLRQFAFCYECVLVGI